MTQAQRFFPTNCVSPKRNTKTQRNTQAQRKICAFCGFPSHWALGIRALGIPHWALGIPPLSITIIKPSARRKGYNLSMFHYYKPIEVRFGDLDSLGHVNNARYLTYMEQARIGYFHHLGLWWPRVMPKVGLILADAQVTFRRPILLENKVKVGVRIPRLGNKSFPMEYRLEDAESGELFATGQTVQVCYDYQAQRTIPIPDEWRRVIAAFEGFAEAAQEPHA